MKTGIIGLMETTSMTIASVCELAPPDETISYRRRNITDGRQGIGVRRDRYRMARFHRLIIVDDRQRLATHRILWISHVG
jgi:hypothetical protein